MMVPTSDVEVCTLFGNVSWILTKFHAWISFPDLYISRKKKANFVITVQYFLDIA